MLDLYLAFLIYRRNQQLRASSYILDVSNRPNKRHCEILHTVYSPQKCITRKQKKTI